jgi:hypothetical protein
VRFAKLRTAAIFGAMAYAAGTLASQHLRCGSLKPVAWIHGETADKVHEQSMLVRKNLILWFIPEKRLKRLGGTPETSWLLLTIYVLETT